LAHLGASRGTVVQLFQPALSGALSDEAREQLVHLGSGTVFVLPAGEAEDRLDVLRLLLARLLP
jgi:hypothetical protein